MKKILTIVGARPQFIKAASVSKTISRHSEIYEIIVHSGQHFDQNMSSVFFDQLKIPEPKYNLGIQGGTHGAMTGRMLEKIESVLLSERPDLVVVYGDTNTTLAGALAAAKLDIPLAHIEAGLRSWNRQMPEEINRVLTDHLSSVLFCPTFKAIENLRNEGITDHVVHSGDVMYDVALLAADLTRHTSASSAVDTIEDYYLVTLHRAENTDDKTRLVSILKAFRELGKKKKIVWPIHPRARKRIIEWGLKELIANLTVVEPVSFIEMVTLEKNAKIILTDSGGVQKEAYFHSVPCITLRDETEWMETVAAGWNTIVGSKPEKILSAVENVKRGEPIPEYGNGNAAEIIVEQIVDVLGGPQ